jgi:hypothetical protein
MAPAKFQQSESRAALAHLRHLIPHATGSSCGTRLKPVLHERGASARPCSEADAQITGAAAQCSAPPPPRLLLESEPSGTALATP